MYGFWGGRFEKAFIDVRVFNASVQSNRHSPLSFVYRKHGQEKRRQYDQRVREIEHSTFKPLVLSTIGGMGRATTIFYKRLASMVAGKKRCPLYYDSDLDTMPTKFYTPESFCHVYQESEILPRHPATECPIYLQLAEGHLN